MHFSGMVIRTTLYVFFFAGFSRLLARMWASTPKEDGAVQILRPGRMIQALGVVIVVLAVGAPSLMYLVWPEIRASVAGCCWLAGIALVLVAFGVWTFIKASVERVFVVTGGVVEVPVCRRVRHVAWSRVTRLRYLPSGSLQLQTLGGNSVAVGMGLVGFSSFIRTAKERLHPSKWTEALNELHRQYPNA
jgi:hypothetical protein